MGEDRVYKQTRRTPRREVVSKSETVDVFGEEEILENVSDVTIADYALEHKQVLELIFARIVKEDRIK